MRKTNWNEELYPENSKLLSKFRKNLKKPKLQALGRNFRISVEISQVFRGFGDRSEIEFQALQLTFKDLRYKFGKGTGVSWIFFELPKFFLTFRLLFKFVYSGFWNFFRSFGNFSLSFRNFLRGFWIFCWP